MKVKKGLVSILLAGTLALSTMGVGLVGAHTDTNKNQEYCGHNTRMHMRDMHGMRGMHGMHEDNKDYCLHNTRVHKDDQEYCGHNTQMHMKGMHEMYKDCMDKMHKDDICMNEDTQEQE